MCRIFVIISNVTSIFEILNWLSTKMIAIFVDRKYLKIENTHIHMCTYSYVNTNLNIIVWI